MTEMFDSEFHKRYVGGEGEVEVAPITLVSPIRTAVRPTTLEEVEAEYRWYMRDETAVLPEGIRQTFLAISRTENDRKT